MEGKKTKEKTRVLAHSRRQKENDTFTDIAQALPLQGGAKDLDKASLLRVAIHYLKLRHVLHDEEAALQEDGEAPKQNTETSTLPNFSRDMLQALDGFLMVMSREGKLLYVSESIAHYLGLKQVAVIGSHIQDIVHPQDYGELATILQTQGSDIEQVFDPCNPQRRNLVMRMRCAFTPSVQSITRCSNFKPVYCSLYLKFSKLTGELLGITALCKLASVGKIKEMCVGTFLKTKHALNMNFVAVDSRIRWILGYDPAEMIGMKVYQYLHPEDMSVEAVSKCHANLMIKGRSQSPCFRILSRWGDWVWVKSRSYVTYSPVTHLPDGVIIYTWIVRVEEDDLNSKSCIPKESEVVDMTADESDAPARETKASDNDLAQDGSKQAGAQDEDVTQLNSVSRPFSRDQKSPGPLPSVVEAALCEQSETTSQHLTTGLQDPYEHIFESLSAPNHLLTNSSIEMPDPFRTVPTPGTDPAFKCSSRQRLPQGNPKMAPFYHGMHPQSNLVSPGLYEHSLGKDTLMSYPGISNYNSSPVWWQQATLAPVTTGSQGYGPLCSSPFDHLEAVTEKQGSFSMHLSSQLDTDCYDIGSETSDGSPLSAQHPGSLSPDVFTSSATEILGPIIAESDFSDSDLSAFGEMGPNLTELQLLNEDPPLHYEPPCSPSVSTSTTNDLLPYGYVSQARARYMSIASAIGGNDRSHADRTVHAAPWLGLKSSASVH